MVDLWSEELIALTKVPGMIPHRPHISTVHRWWQRGVRGVRLETLLIGGKRHTSREAIDRFIERTNPESSLERVPAIQTPTQRRRQIEEAERAVYQDN